MSHTLFLSHRHTGVGKGVVRELHEWLEKEHHCKVFWDKKGLHAGENWSNDIYEAICASDVLIVVLEAKVLESTWVQREVDTAHGAHVRVLPLHISDEDVREVCEKLDIQAMQLLNYDTGEPPFSAIWAEIERLAPKIRKEQSDFFDKLKRKWDNRPSEMVRATSSNSQAVFQFKNHETRFHLATGDITAVKNIDVIVNSENNYLQMARIYEGTTVSSRLRYYGSLIGKNGIDLVEDTVQMELDANTLYTGLGRPIGLTYVVPTTSGHPKSKLAQRHIRYIFHAVTVKVESEFVPTMTAIDNAGITTCVLNTLNEVQNVNALHGVISPEKLEFHTGGEIRKPNEEQLQHTNDYKPITSIIFPLFCAGQAGRPTGQIIQPMLDGFKQFLEQTPQTYLKDIHLCVYYEHDIAAVEQAMRGNFTSISG